LLQSALDPLSVPPLLPWSWPDHCPPVHAVRSWPMCPYGGSNYLTVKAIQPLIRCSKARRSWS